MAFRQFCLGFVAFTIVIAGAVWFTLKRESISYEALEKVYAQDESVFLDLPGGIYAHVVDRGPRHDAPTLVLVHGLTFSTSAWRDWILELETQHRVIAVDLPGHGLTRAPHSYRASVDAASAFLDDVADALELEAFTLAGASMGGAVAWNYAIDHADRVENLVLIGAEGWPLAPEELAADPLSDSRYVQDWMRPFLERIDMSSWLEEYLRACFIDQTLVSEEMIRRHTDFSLAPGHRRAMLDYELAPTRSATAKLLEGLEIPSLIMHGEKDAITPERTVRLFEAALPYAAVISYEGVGHAPHIEVPKRSASDLVEFLNRDSAQQANRTPNRRFATIASSKSP